jgi:hypothetical protein
LGFFALLFGGLSLFLGCYEGFCARKCASVKIGKAEMHRNKANLRKSARFLQFCSAVQLVSDLGEKKSFHKLPILTCAFAEAIFQCPL